MMQDSDYQQALMGGPGEDTTPPYTRTKDPNVMMGRHGVPITKADMDAANKNGMAWQSLDEFANWMGSWAHKMPDFKNVQPYYRTYPSGKINGGDIALLMAKNDPGIDQILQRNIAKDGEIPLYGADDSDALKKLISASKTAQNTDIYDKLIQPKGK